MATQPTAILVLFTDFLNNRDSIAFFRLSRSFWLSHRSPAGRYRLKASDDEKKFLRPSTIPARCLHSPLSSPCCGHFLLESLRVEDNADFSLFLPPPLEEIPTGLRNVKKVSIKLDEITNLDSSSRKFPASVEVVGLVGAGLVSVHEVKAILPLGVKKLDFGGFCPNSTSPEDMDFSGFPYLESLEVWPDYDFPLRTGLFPPALRKLKFYGDFNQQIAEGFLPEDLEEFSIQVYSEYDHPLPARLPRNLKVLDLLGFRHPLSPGQLPEGLKILKITTNSFRHPLPLGCLPQSLEEFVFQVDSFDDTLLPGVFPKALQRLHLNFHYGIFSHPIPPGVLPEALKHLEIYLCDDYSHPPPPLPAGLKSLSFNNSLNFLLDSPGHLPDQLKIIEIVGSPKTPLQVGIFPASVESINFGWNFNVSLPVGIFPVGLKKIILGAAYNQPLPVGIFPEGVHTIELEKRFSYPLEVGLFPSSVRKLKIFTAHPLPMGIFPEGLESIEFNSAFNQLLLPGIFPSSLRSLEFSHSFGVSSFQQDFLPGVLPEFLCELQLSSYYGFFPLSALPPYFHPDSSVLPAVPHRLKVPKNFPAHFRSSAFSLLSRLGHREFFKKSCRALVSPETMDFPRPTEYFLAEPIDGVGDSFLLHGELFTPDNSKDERVCLLS